MNLLQVNELFINEYHFSCHLLCMFHPTKFPASVELTNNDRQTYCLLHLGVSILLLEQMALTSHLVSNAKEAFLRLILQYY